MSLPEPVTNYLRALLADKINPTTLELDHDGGLVAWWGVPGDVGLSAIRTSFDVESDLPWLHGTGLKSTTTLEQVNLANGRIYDIHILPARSSTFIVFLPVADKAAMQRELQQTANEVRLLNHQQQRLLDKLAAAHREVEQRQREAARANEVKSRFIAGMSHEFRTPLTSVLGYADLIFEQVQDKEELSAYAAAIGRGARHLLSMVDNVLDQARLEEDSVVLHIAPVDVRQVTDDLAAIVAPLAAEKLLGFGAYVGTDVPQFVLTDVVRLRQVFLNVLGNAIKFTDDGEVRLEIDWQDEELIACVSDTGPGIPEAEIERIFEEFQRGSGSEGTRGAGLGLNITRRILELLEGTIDVESEPGVGSRFSIMVPARIARHEEPTEAPVAASLSKRSSANHRILVAEDDQDIVELMQIILGRAGYQLSLAANGLEAVECALRDAPDLVLMDVNMPGLDGLGAAREIRRRGFDGPVIALTASLSARDRSQAFDAGCDGYLIKPIGAAELLSAIERFLETA